MVTSEDAPREIPRSLGDAREQFLALVAEVRPALHRYCARLTGSVIEGEDIVQEALARAFYALSQSPEMPPLRPWLFRIAHNAALDFLKSHARKHTELREELEDVADQAFDGAGPADPAVVRAALGSFLALPLTQRSAVILKDVLGCSLEEAAATMGTSVAAVKAALVRGRRQLTAGARDEQALEAEARARLDRYARLFNARDWEGLRALIGADCHLDLVSKSQRRGKQVGLYFTNYEKQDVRLRVARLDGALVLAAFVAGAPAPSYFILLEGDAAGISLIRDFRYVPYIADEAEVELL